MKIVVIIEETSFSTWAAKNASMVIGECQVESYASTVVSSSTPNLCADSLKAGLTPRNLFDLRVSFSTDKLVAISGSMIRHCSHQN